MNRDCNCSFAEINATKVAMICSKYIGLRNQRIAQKRKKLIERAMTSRWSRPKSPQEAKDRLEKEPFGEYRMAEIEGLTYALKIEALLSLALWVGDGKIFVSAEDAHILHSVQDLGGEQ